MKNGWPWLFLAACCLAGCQETEKSSVQIEDARFEVGAMRLKNVIGVDLVEQIARSHRITFQDDKGVKREFTKEQVERCKELILNDEGYLFDIKKKVLFILTYQLDFMSTEGKQIAKVEMSIPSKQIKFLVGSKKGQKIIVLDDDPMSEQIEELFLGYNLENS
jgi:hypothetical protein